MTAFIFGIISIIFALVIGAVGGFILAMYVMDEAEKEKKADDEERCQSAQKMKARR